jgi:flagellar biosynthesis protein FlhF
MKIKRYVVRDMSEAMRAIKADLGPDAVIISSRKVRSRGVWGYFLPRRLEVTAVLDEPQQAQQVQTPPVSAAVSSGSNSPTSADTPTWLTPPTTSPPVPEKAPVVQFYRELSEIRDMLSRFSHLRPGGAEGDGAFYHEWQRLLEDMEIEPPYVEKMMTALRAQVDPKDIQRNDLARVCLQNEIVRLVEPAYADQGQSRLLAFIGPTGVGKTTTLAKLAAQYTLFHGKNCAVITIDTYRIGAVEQLKIYAEIMGVPLEIAMTPRDFQEAVHRHRNKDFIFVDTAGRPSHNVEKVVELKSYFDMLDEPADIILVLSCNTKYRDLVRSARQFGPVQYSKLIFTKVDETDTLGCILNIICHTGLPVTHITDGQNVPDDIQSLYPKKLAKILTRGVAPDA